MRLNLCAKSLRRLRSKANFDLASRLSLNSHFRAACGRIEGMYQQTNLPEPESLHLTQVQRDRGKKGGNPLLWKFPKHKRLCAAGQAGLCTQLFRNNTRCNQKAVS